MTEVFSAIKIEAYLNSAWVDLTPDVRQSPAPRVSGMGVTGRGLNDRLGDAGTFTFTLDNSISNSGGVNGYYTPDHGSVRSGWRAGVAVQLYFEYDGWRKYWFYGYIDTDGIVPTAGRYGERSVSVTASNWLKYAAEQKMGMLERKTNYNIFNSVQDIIDRTERKPLNIEFRGTDASTFPTVFDGLTSETKASAELNALALSQMSYIYIDTSSTSGEVLAIETRSNARFSQLVAPVNNADITDNFLLEDGTSNLLLESGDKLLMENNQNAVFTDTDIYSLTVRFGANMANRVTFTTHPRTVDSSTVVLSTLEEPIYIEAGQTIENVSKKYKDPNNQDVEVSGFGFVAPVATTDYLMFQNSDGTGTNYTANLTVTALQGAGEVRYSALTNGSASNAYITKLDQRGKGVYWYKAVDKVYESSSSITNYGEFPVNIDMKYLDSIVQLYSFYEGDSAIWSGGNILDSYDLPVLEVESITFIVNKSKLLMQSFMNSQMNRSFAITETMTGLATDYFWVHGCDLEILQGKFVKWTMYPKTISRYA